MNNDEKVTYFGQTDSRAKRVAFGVKAKDRTRHIYVIGKTGMGKSTLLENMAVQDIQSGEGMAFIDPHGKTAELLLNYIPENRIKDLLYFAPFDMENPISFNVLEDVGVDKRHLVVNGLMSAFKKIWVDAWSARMEYILNNILLALLEYPDATLMGVNKMLADKDYRKKVIANITDPSVKAFWVDEFLKYGEKYMQEAGAAIQNKIGQFISNPLVRNIIGQPKSSFDIRKMMDEKKILIINLSKGRVGEGNANLLGSMLITKIYLAAMSRADMPERVLKGMPNFYLYVDEFQSFANESFADILSEARKYKLNLTIAHQYIEQMSEEVRAAVFGNVGSMFVFRVGAYDAEVLEKEFAPQFTMEDIVNLGMYQIYLKLMIDGVTSPPFSATTLPPIKEPERTWRDEAIESSRRQYSRPRAEVEEFVRKQSLSEEPLKAPQAPSRSRSDYGEQQREQQPRRKEESRPRAEPIRDAPKPQPPVVETPRVHVERPKNTEAVKPFRELLEQMQKAEVSAERLTNTHSGGTSLRDAVKAVAPQYGGQGQAVPLTSLQKHEVSKDDQKKNNKKEATPENMSALKKTLEAVHKHRGHTVTTSQPQNKETPKQNDGYLSGKDSEEVSIETLKKVLSDTQ